jgi:septum formation protein
MGSSRSIVLASASPRRRQLLEAACFDVEVRPSGVDETWPGGAAEQAVVTLARRKLDAVVDAERPTVAADTVVMLGDEPLGKPADARDAARMLGALAGREHTVVTGFCVGARTARREGAVVTRVSFRKLSREEIERYVDSGEPFDKAGAYAIQGEGGALIDRVVGSYTNIVGLPLAEVIAAIQAVQA